MSDSDSYDKIMKREYEEYNLEREKAKLRSDVYVDHGMTHVSAVVNKILAKIKIRGEEAAIAKLEADPDFIEWIDRMSGLPEEEEPDA